MDVLPPLELPEALSDKFECASEDVRTDGNEAGSSEEEKMIFGLDDLSDNEHDDGEHMEGILPTVVFYASDCGEPGGLACSQSPSPKRPCDWSSWASPSPSMGCSPSLAAAFLATACSTYALTPACQLSCRGEGDCGGDVFSAKVAAGPKLLAALEWLPAVWVS